ncbi:hypothetical protein QBC32DRAFT_336356 [Pseudoneurospora amorphoporcata]|uniref:Uncharacterized protein n=1 Tax=Pseudoneurospora amorphoporcata TaxID=241081 RepID=A0AAN6P0K3_9PEZI|nr:hypothetical protein QBC32DRAFT_336356 [Pseudoneurospora amorphoporcata]
MTTGYHPVRHERVISVDSLTPLTAAVEPQAGDGNNNINNQSFQYVDINGLPVHAGAVPQQPDQTHPAQQPLYADHHPQQQYYDYQYNNGDYQNPQGQFEGIQQVPLPIEGQQYLSAQGQEGFMFPPKQPTTSSSVVLPMSASPAASWEKQNRTKHANRHSTMSSTSGSGGSSNMKSDKLSAIFSKNGTWTYESISMLVALGAVASIIAVLATYDGQPLPSWPHWITLNAVIAILATVATASMSVPLSSGLGQLKWIRFKQGRAPLSDMEIYDDASRGAFGAVNMLVQARGGFAGSFGAVVMIIALFLSPFAQQIATFPTRIVETPHDGGGAGAVNYRTESYGLALHGKEELGQAFVPILPIKAAVYKGLFAEDGRPWMGLPFRCSTGNCTFPPIETLGVCHKCVDMSEYMTRYCPPGLLDSASDDDDDEKNQDELCGWQLPSGMAKLNSSAEVFGMTSLFPGSSSTGDATYSTIMKLIFMGTETNATGPGVLSPWATQCTLSVCLQTLSSNITNGFLHETPLSDPITNDTVPSLSSSSSSAAQESDLAPLTIQSPTNSSLQYSMSMQSIMAMQSWFSRLFANGTASRNPSYINKTVSGISGDNPGHGQNVVVNLTVGISSGETFFDTDIVQAFYWNYYEYPSPPGARAAKGLEMLLSDLSVSLTSTFRTLVGVPVNGTSLSVETYVSVRWGFVALPVVAVLLAAVFLALAAWETKRSGANLWKTSALAMLFHGLDEDARERFEDLRSLEAKKRESRNVRVRLSAEEGSLDGGKGGTLLKIDRVYDME